MKTSAPVVAKVFATRPKMPTGGEADHEADHELDALGGVIEHFARGDGAMAQHDAHGDGPGENADVVAGRDGVDGIVNDVENHVAEHLADAAGGGGHSVGRRQDELRGEHEARHDRNDGGGEGAYQIEDDDRLDVEVFAGQVLVRNRTHHEHEHQNRGDGLKSRHKDGAEEAAADGCGGSRIGKRNAKYQTDQNLLDKRCLQERHRKIEDSLHCCTPGDILLSYGLFLPSATKPRRHSYAFVYITKNFTSNTLFFQASQPPKCQSDLQLLIRIKATGWVPPRLSPASPACGSPSAPSAPPCDSR